MGQDSFQRMKASMLKLNSRKNKDLSYFLFDDLARPNPILSHPKNPVHPV